jgi:F-box and leucine-rich repeat protein 6
LEELDISNITTTTREPIYINIEKFQKGCPKLSVLNANHTMISLCDTPIKEQIQSPGFPEMRELSVAVDSRGYFEGMDDSQIERVLKNSEKLKLLDIRGCQHVSDSCLIRLPTWDIEKLVLSGCSAASSSDQGVELMVRKWAANLVEVDVSGTGGERAVNHAVEAFAEADETKIR